MSESSSVSRIVSPRRAAVLLAVAVFFLGTNWPVLKIAMRSIEPIWFTTLRMCTAGLVFALILGLRGKLIIPSRRDMPMVLSLGLLQFGIMSTLVVYGVSVVGAGRTAMLIYTTPIWVTLGSILFYRQKPTRAQVVGTLFGIAGLTVLFSPFGIDWTDRHVLIGNGSVVLGAIVWSVPLLQVRHHKWQADPLQLLPYETALGSLVSFCVAISFEGWLPHIQWNWEFGISFATVVLLATNISFWGLVTAGRSLPPIAVSLGQLATPVIGVAFASFLIAEIPTWADIIGLLLIVCGVAVAVVFGRTRAASPPAPAR
jgi:drug/metabolite transporter (DMT)-like permease